MTAGGLVLFPPLLYLEVMCVQGCCRLGVIMLRLKVKMLRPEVSMLRNKVKMLRLKVIMLRLQALVLRPCSKPPPCNTRKHKRTHACADESTVAYTRLTQMPVLCCSTVGRS